MRQPKKILLVAYHYYPDLQVGAQRTIKYVKYLPQFGWQPHVLTVNPRYYPQIDKSPAPADCPVYRTGMWPRPDDIYSGLKGFCQRLRPRPDEAPVSAGTAGGPKAEKWAEPPTWKKFLNSLSLTPDVFAGWYVPAAFAAWRLIRKHKFDIIYSSGPPQTCHLVGLTAHRLTGVPWVIDFRDPWLFPKERDRHVLRWSKRFDEKYEAESVRRASLVIATADEWRDHLMQRYRPALDRKCHTIVNGFDEDDFERSDQPDTRSESAPIKFLHAGNLYSGRDPSAMLQAGGELLAEGFLRARDVVFAFYGNTDIDTTRTNRIISEHNMEQVVTFAPPVSRAEYLDLLKAADVLVLVQADTAQVHIPAKAFEYLGTGREILVLTSEGATKNFMSRFDHVQIAELNDTEQIKSCIRRIVQRRRDGLAYDSGMAALSGITKRALTGEFAGLLDSIVAGKQTG